MENSIKQQSGLSIVFIHSQHAWVNLRRVICCCTLLLLTAKVGNFMLLADWPHGHGTPYHNTSRTRPLFSSFAENWRPFCSGRRSLTLYDNVLCFICSPVVQCLSVTMYWLLQTDFVDTVRWSCISSAIVPPKSYSFLLLLLVSHPEYKPQWHLCQLACARVQFLKVLFISMFLFVCLTAATVWLMLTLKGAWTYRVYNIHAAWWILVWIRPGGVV